MGGRVVFNIYNIEYEGGGGGQCTILVLYNILYCGDTVSPHPHFFYGREGSI
jgi:hypothetical protein